MVWSLRQASKKLFTEWCFSARFLRAILFCTLPQCVPAMGSAWARLSAETTTTIPILPLVHLLKRSSEQTFSSPTPKVNLPNGKLWWAAKSSMIFFHCVSTGTSTQYASDCACDCTRTFTVMLAKKHTVACLYGALCQKKACMKKYFRAAKFIFNLWHKYGATASSPRSCEITKFTSLKLDTPPRTSVALALNCANNVCTSVYRCIQ